MRMEYCIRKEKVSGRKMSRKVETTTDLRVNNRKELLNLLIRKGSATRNELKDETKFSYTTTGNLIGDLHEAGLCGKQVLRIRLADAERKLLN